jgi:YVTN family beta-propeller protein
VPNDVSRRRFHLAVVCVAGLVLLDVPPGSAQGVSGRGPQPRPSNTAPAGPKWDAPREPPQARRATGPYVAYVAVAGGYTVATIDVTAHRIVASDISTDAAQGVAATPDGAKLYIADTGQYDVLVVEPADGSARSLHVGPFPHDVAISPGGTKVYATVTGGDTGSGGSDTVAVIDTRSDRVARHIRVGNAPRQVVFAADGGRAYVTYDSGVAVLDARKDRLIRTIPDTAGPQGIAVDPAGRTLYVTEPRADTVAVIDAASGRVRARIPAGDQPWDVAVTPDGAKAYVSRMNADAVAVIDTAARRLRRTVAVGRIPSVVALTPDGTEVWVGNVMSGSISVISTASDAVIATVAPGPGSKPVHAAPLGIAFARNPGQTSPEARRPAETRPKAGRQGPPAGSAAGRPRKIVDHHDGVPPFLDGLWPVVSDRGIRPFVPGDLGSAVPIGVLGRTRSEDGRDHSFLEDPVGDAGVGDVRASADDLVEVEPAAEGAGQGDGGAVSVIGGGTSGGTRIWDDTVLPGSVVDTPPVTTFPGTGADPLDAAPLGTAFARSAG